MNIFETGTVYINGERLTAVSSAQWLAHPKFAGVFTKNLFTGGESGGHMSAMLVRIEARHEIGSHIHQGKAELHEVLEGRGSARVGQITVDYGPGTVSLIPADLEHSIHAGDSDMLLLAKFTPPHI
jgi:quercetin dioxygenase-like cupin family protein